MYSDPKFVTDRLSYAVSVIGFGADPDGIEDSSAAFAAAIAVCRERNYSTLHVPAGVYELRTFTNNIGWLLEGLSGLCIRGDGIFRSGSADQVGTRIRFKTTTADQIGISIKGSEAIRFENVLIQGAVDKNVATPVIGVRVESVPAAGMEPAKRASGIQFHNCSFLWCEIAVQTANTEANSELAFYDCLFNSNHIGFQTLSSGSIAHRFIGCVGGGSAGLDDDPYQGMDVMFDLVDGGNITVVGFGGQNMLNLVRVGAGSGSVGWNLLHNIRLEQFGNGGTNTWGNEFRIRLYEAAEASSATSGQRTEFDGIVITPPGAGEVPETGASRFSILDGHTVVVRNASRAASYQLASPTAPLLEFKSTGGTAGGTFRAFNVTVPLDARLDRTTVPALGRYSFHECNNDNVPYPDRLHPPLYGPNYLMDVEYHCWAVGDALVGVNAFSPATGNDVVVVDPSSTSRSGVIECKTTVNGHATLISHTGAMRPGASTWRFQASVRVTATVDGRGDPEFEVRLGFGDKADAEPDNGVYFRYRNGVNGDRWEAVMRWDGGTESAIDTDEPKDEDWHTFEIEVDEAGGTATFYIDGNRIVTQPADTPSANSETGLMPLQFVRVGGTGTKSAEIDYYKYQIRPANVGEMFPE